MPAPGRRPAPPLAVLWLAFVGCSGSGKPPSILTIPEQNARVNVPLTFDVAATDDDTETLKFSMAGAPQGASLRQIAGKIARFEWTPNPAQVGFVTLTFVADDGTAKDTETAGIRVVGGTAPTLASSDRYLYDAAEGLVVSFVLDVRDDDADMLDTSLDPDPTEWGAEVEISDTGKRVSLEWRPTAEQQRTPQYRFVLHSADLEGDTLLRAITIIFRAAGCPAGLTPPSVKADEIGPQSGTDDYPVLATATDADTRVQRAWVKWTTVDEPVERDWLSAALRPAGSDLHSGTIPNLHLGEGESAQVTWKVCAVDDDDAAGDTCDHTACSTARTFAATAGAALCDPCPTGGCGTSGICLQTGAGESFCGADCAPGDACPAGFGCLEIGLTSGGTRKQCIPSGCIGGGADDPMCSCSVGRASAPQPGELVVNEVLYDPPDSCPPGQDTCDQAVRLVVDVNGDGVRNKYNNEADEEFVEIVNRSARYLQLQGVTVSDATTVRFTFPALVLAPGRAAVVFGGGDPTKFGGLGGAVHFSSAWGGGVALSLSNTGDSMRLVLPGGTVIDQMQYGGGTAGRAQSLVRQTEGDPSAPFVGHPNAPHAAGAKYSPGTHTCGTPFPLDDQACVPPACTVLNAEGEPDNDARATAPCLRPLPQTISGTLAWSQTNPADDDERDLFVIDGTAGQWLNARTQAGTAPDLRDTYLRLLARNGTQLAANDDDPWDKTSYYSRLVLQFPSDGVYFLEVSPLEPSAARTGSYQLVVETSATEPQPPQP